LHCSEKKEIINSRLERL